MPGVRPVTVATPDTAGPLLQHGDVVHEREAAEPAADPISCGRYPSLRRQRGREQPKEGGLARFRHGDVLSHQREDAYLFLVEILGERVAERR
jgi:hypothetical protein